MVGRWPKRHLSRPGQSRSVRVGVTLATVLSMFEEGLLRGGASWSRSKKLRGTGAGAVTCSASGGQ
jgi:hypothetical protein